MASSPAAASPTGGGTQAFFLHSTGVRTLYNYWIWIGNISLWPDIVQQYFNNERRKTKAFEQIHRHIPLQRYPIVQSASSQQAPALVSQHSFTYRFATPSSATTTNSIAATTTTAATSHVPILTYIST
eukprot:scaffold48694_cov56-Cyclotella_meneghiniana.AAC.1